MMNTSVTGMVNSSLLSSPTIPVKSVAIVTTIVGPNRSQFVSGRVQSVGSITIGILMRQLIFCIKG